MARFMKKEKKRGRSRGPEKQQVPSGGAGICCFVFFLPCFLPVAGTSITRVVFVIIRGRDTRGRDTKRRNRAAEPRACEKFTVRSSNEGFEYETAANRVRTAIYPCAICVNAAARWLRVFDAFGCELTHRR